VLTIDVLILSVIQISNQMGTVKAHVIFKNFRGRGNLKRILLVPRLHQTRLKRSQQSDRC